MMSRFPIWLSFIYISLHIMIIVINCQDDCQEKDKGKHFIIAFPDSYMDVVPDQILHVVIVTLQERITTVNISSPYRLSDNSFFERTATVQPLSYDRVIVPNELELIGNERSFKTIEIVSDFNISVHTFHLTSYISDGYLAISSENFGTQYVLSSNEVHMELGYTLPGSFTIFGSENDTSVQIQLNSAVTYESSTYSSGDILNLNVSRLEAVQITSSGDLTGSIIISDKPIGVISGHSCYKYPELRSGCDAFHEQNIPVNFWGIKHFYSATGEQPGRSRYRMVAFFNDTSFNVNNSLIKLESGEFHEFDLTGSGVLSTTNPASLFQILTHIDGNTVDPSLIQVPTENQFARMLGFTTPPASGSEDRNFTNFVNIIVKSDERESMRLNGAEITNRRNDPLPYIVSETKINGSDYDLMVVRLSKEESVYFITQDLIDYSPMSAIVYGYQDSESYGYVAEVSLSPLPPPTPSLQSAIIKFNLSTCFADISLNWTTPSTTGTEDRYFLYLNGTLVASTASNSLIHSTILNDDTNYGFSVIASSCSGNSTESLPSIINITALPLPTPSLQSTIFNFNPSTCSADISLTFSTLTTTRKVDIYILFLNGVSFAVSTSNTHIYTTTLSLNTNYEYTVLASSCSGNSSESLPSIINIRGYSLSANDELLKCLNFNDTTGELTVNWGLTNEIQNTEIQGLEIRYSLELDYSYSRKGEEYTFTTIKIFTLPSSQFKYDTVLNTHNFAKANDIETKITANLKINEQCGQTFNGMDLTCNISGASPNIIAPPFDITKSVSGANDIIASIECAANGDPTPVVYWTRDFSTKFVDSSTLQIRFTDLATEGENVFYCVAENKAGRDVVSVTYEVVISSENVQQTIDDVMNKLENVISISNEESGENADITKVLVDSANNNDNIDSENKSIILENAANTAGLIVNKTNGTFSSETAEKISGLLSSVTEGSLQLDEPSTVSQAQVQDESTVASISTALATTLNILERFSQRLSNELETTEVNTVKTVQSEFITIVVQNIALNMNNGNSITADIVLPKTSSGDEQYSVEIKFSHELASSLSANGNNLAIATSIVKRVETKNLDSDESTQGSDILTISIAGMPGTVALEEPATLTFDVYSSEPSNTTCVFLKDTSWVSNGLQTVQSSSNLTHCITNHFTSFAVFVTPYKPDRSSAESLAISIISYFLVGISFISLIISLILFIVAGKPFFKVETNIVYFNYCISMLLATGVFIFGIEVGKFDHWFCMVIAFLMHYSWTAVFTWTLCISILILYKIVISVLSTRKIYWFLIVFGWVFPIFEPVITIAITRENYTNSTRHCFLNTDYNVIWAFIAPIFIILIINAIFLIIAIIRIIHSKAANENNETRNVVKNALITGLILTPVLGLPWLFLIFNITIHHSALEWAFIIMNGLMGFIFLIVVVLRNKEVAAIFKRKKLISSSNTHPGQNTLSSANASTLASDRFKKPDTLSRQLEKEAKIKAAEIEPYEVFNSPTNTTDNIYKTERGMAEEEFTGYSNNIYETSDDPPTYQNLSVVGITTEVHANPLYQQLESQTINPVYCDADDVIGANSELPFRP